MRVVFLVDGGSGGVDSPDAGDGNHDILRNHRRGHSSDGGGKNALNAVYLASHRKDTFWDFYSRCFVCNVTE